MKLSDLIQCRRHKSVFGRQLKGFVATDCRHSIEVKGDTKEEAVRAVAAILIDQAYFCSPSYFWSPDNTMWVLRYSCGNWQYDMVRGCGNGHTHSSICVMNVEIYNDALEQMMDHKKAYDADLV